MPVAKIQPTAALRVRNPYDPQVRRTLQDRRGRLPHQVVARKPRRLQRFIDLSIALAAPPAGADEWRIHAHAPVAVDATGPVGTTQQQASTLLGALGRAATVRHVEVETYCWAALPAPHRATDVVEGVVRELAWVTGHLTAVAKSA